MNKDNINISKVETYLNSILDNVVSNNTFFGYRPDEAVIKSTDWQDMCVVEIPNGIHDYGAYGKGTVLVWLYARPLDSGRKNVSKMSQLETKLNEVIKEANDKTFHIDRRLTYTSYNKEIGWHCNVVELIIKVY
jgi:hypothetical protein